MTLDPIFQLSNLLALLIVLAGGFVRGYTGFGSGLVMAPLFAILWGPVDAVATTAGLGLLATVQLTASSVPLVNWRDVLPMLAAAILLVPFGAALLVSLDPDLVKNIIAILVMAMALITIRGWTYRGPRGAVPSMISGALSGFINGISSVGGPAAVLYFLAIPDAARIQRANIIIVMGFTGMAVLVSLIIAGVVTATVYINIGVLAIPSFAAVWLGARLFTVLPVRLFRLIVLWFLVVVSIAILAA
ncbi:MAG: sulfite exporter TauE/SafE family protein [Rhodospirillaceae bacterium]|nr:sulfite exporter TauE/SafE family protein [Rhodospirillaceae bacterium]MBT5177985.1 sulfite exporter TauE/SafE family protein [Rhodospirillaceae bacterium]